MSDSTDRSWSLRPRFHRRTKPGARPGALKVCPDAAPPRVRVIAYSRDDVMEVELSDPAKIRELMAEWPVVWVNVDGLGDAAMLRQFADAFQIHPLALEDVVNVHQRAKVEEYEEHLFCVVRSPHAKVCQLTEQLSLFIGKNYVLSFQEEQGDCFDPVRIRLRKSDSNLRSEPRADYLGYRLIDSVIDGYFPVLEEIGNRLDDLDDRTINTSNDTAFAELHSVKRELLMYRRAVWPLRDLVNELRADTNDFISDRTRLYLRDSLDHAVQVIEVLETYREICADMRDSYLSAISNRMNEVMQTLTVIATIFIPLSFIAGLYGMNFNPERSPWNMPELNWVWGYPFALLLMFSVAGGMLLYFWRRGWLGSRKR